MYQFELKLYVIGSEGDIYWSESAEFLPAQATPYMGSYVWKPNDGPNLKLSRLQLTEQLSSTQRRNRPTEIESTFQANWAAKKSIFSLLEEIFYFVPVHLALQLQKSGEYQAALDWFRLVYDFTLPSEQAELLGLYLSSGQSDQFVRQINWLLDPLNPHAIAETRTGTYLRFTLLSIAKCLLDYADAEFTRDTAETIPRARNLYLAALELLISPALKQQVEGCEKKIGELDFTIGDPRWIEVMPELKVTQANVPNKVDLEAGLRKIKEEMESNGDGTYEQFIKKFLDLKNYLAVVQSKIPRPPKLEKLWVEEAEKVPQLHSELLRYPSFVQTVESISSANGFDVSAPVMTAQQFAMGDGTRAMVVRSSLSRENILDFLTKKEKVWMPAPTISFCVPPNPVLRNLRLRAHLNLYKIRTCRNIAGMQRELALYSAATDTTSGLPAIGAGGQLVVPGVFQIQPTLYRYPALIERAKQLVQLAVQIEAAFLSALEKRDKEEYDLLRARADVRLAQAGVRLQDLRVTEAESNKMLTDLQIERNQIQLDYFDELLNEGLLNSLELQALELMKQSASLQYTVAAVNTTIGGALVGSAIGGMILGNPAAFATAEKGWGYLSQGLLNTATAHSTQASILLTQSSYERRRREWQHNYDLAHSDMLISQQQRTIASNHLQVVEQERVIEQMRADHAKEVLDFLTNKFTNKDLYDWMSGILERVYSFFLQQATAVAQLAANQLAFERQEPPPTYIQADYWEMPSENGAEGSSPDRRGLTGSARLLQDIYQLDQYAFETNKRKLQLTKTISLVQLDPFAFQQFRETGMMTFAMPLELFDRDFPGHYLRLIRRVRTSIVALIPPAQGIRATLSSSGLSRVIIGGDLFQATIIRREPETVALTSPTNATGLFELEQQSDMLFPFEGMGVNATWEFRLPKAANPIDYQTIADVLITIEYTALNSFDYRQQVIQSPALTRPLSSDRSFSFRLEFADEWYDLHNPELEGETEQMVAKFETRREDFPPNLENLKIHHVVLYFARKTGSSFEIPVTHLRFAEQGSPGMIGDSATSIDGVISTRRGNAGSWMAMIGKSPFGKWELALPNTDEMKKRFKNEEIEDILFVITYSGRTPEWPA